jgi:hypothetical protein
VVRKILIALGVVVILLSFGATAEPTRVALGSLRAAVHNATGPEGPCGR